MTPILPTDRVVQILEVAGYKSLPAPLVVASIPFDFSAALVGTGNSADLIVVADSTQEKDSRILQRIEGLAGALDAMSSVRPLTLVVSGTKPNTRMLDAMAGVCRVLVVDGASDTDQINRRLAVLLPLTLPNVKSPVADIANLMPLTGKEDPVTLDLMSAAEDGADEVKKRLFDLVSAPFVRPSASEEAV